MKPTAWMRPAIPEPIVLVEEFIEHSRLNTPSPSERAYVELLLSAAHDSIEGYTGSSLAAQSWVATYPGWPCAGGRLLLPRGPVTAVTAVKFYDEAGALQVLDAGLYHLDAGGSLADGVALVDSATWPMLASDRSTPVSVEYDTGYASAAEIPAALRLAVLQLASHWFENREPVVTGITATSLPMHVQALIMQHDRRLR